MSKMKPFAAAVVHALRASGEIERIRGLKALHKMYEDGLLCADEDRLVELRERLNVKHRLAECAENGKVLIVESGRDCDCVEYDGKCYTIDASIDAYSKLYDEIADWADGPFWLSMDRPSNAHKYKYTSRDRILEAFEDGHPHLVYVSR